jgi:hypothetical protein
MPSAGQTAALRDSILNVTNQHLVGEDFTGKDLFAFKAQNSLFEECDFSRTRVNDFGFGCGTKTSTYRRCRFDGAEIRSIAVGRAIFEECTFTSVRIVQFNAHGAEFINCVFSGVLNKSIFSGRDPNADGNPTRNKLNRFLQNDFQAAELRDVSFRGGIDLLAQKLPVGNGYLLMRDGRRALDKLSQLRASQSDAAAARELSALEYLMEFDLSTGQTSVFWSRTSLRLTRPSLLDVVFEELRDT